VSGGEEADVAAADLWWSALPADRRIRLFRWLGPPDWLGDGPMPGEQPLPYEQADGVVVVPVDPEALDAVVDATTANRGRLLDDALADYFDRMDRRGATLARRTGWRRLLWGP
jgi:hypothetical protein